MMYHKALLMSDEEIAEETLKARSPEEAKRLGMRVRYFKQEIWDEKCDRIVEEEQYLKFSQNKDLRKVLLGTGRREIMEMSPNDRVCGVGFHTADAEGHVGERGAVGLGRH
jgi:ribA/ribD-fused uncharacterized protein